MKLDIQDIELQFKQEKKSKKYSDSLSLRLHRAISWFGQAKAREDDLDFCFISAWIAFNAIYADELRTFSERSNFKNFLSHIWQLDTGKLLDTIVWETFSNNIRILLKNKFTFQPFWDEYNECDTEQVAEKWKQAFEKEAHRASYAISKQKTDLLLHIVFKRLYTVRNQIMHGGATYNSSVNVTQKKDACRFMLSVLPCIIKIMMDNAREDWGKPYYPVIK